MAATPASGTQHALRSGDYEAVIASVGATLRSLTYQGRDLIVPFDADEVRPSFRGATLAPWPNRVVDGTYSFDGVEYQLPLTEPARSHALHGLASWLDFDAVDKGSDHVTLAAVIQPQTAYPWRIVVSTTFALGADGLTQTVTARNESASPAPWGTATHPYLVAGPGHVDDWTLELPATQVLEVTADRLSPVALTSVETPATAHFDFRQAKQLGSVFIDHAYTGLVRDADGAVTVSLTDGAGVGVAMTWGEDCPWVQIHTADKPVAELSRLGLAVEPMTCAPDAFNASAYDYDAGLLVIEPGAQASASWRYVAIG
ncbi:aldose 1-epimerase [Microbacterium terrae]|uniref:Aldose 1-epimerase n=1 Tax=Microbacterium terrae TaxID=69369 RepID=A0A0M2GY75_9MICO|nr:aldose 1-epimerase family protein [Microbacterium terrae]KJL38720.1 Aldose 1-epimerase [Microbacterium terrae]MBP1076139.1 aldose 1-epimerase [Microbacterium terrae]GLJ96959.1 galactose mutarotase [Microbacterium terrae]